MANTGARTRRSGMLPVPCRLPWRTLRNPHPRAPACSRLGERCRGPAGRVACLCFARFPPARTRVGEILSAHREPILWNHVPRTPQTHAVHRRDNLITGVPVQDRTYPILPQVFQTEFVGFHFSLLSFTNFLLALTKKGSVRSFSKYTSDRMLALWGRVTAIESHPASPEVQTEQRISALLLEAGLDAFGV